MRSFCRCCAEAQSCPEQKLARRTGLSEGAISRITAELLEDKLILEQGSQNSTGGRPGQRLELDLMHFRSVGVEIRDWETRISIGTLELARFWSNRMVRRLPSPTQTLDEVAAAKQRAAQGRRHSLTAYMVWASPFAALLTTNGGRLCSAVHRIGPVCRG